MLYYVWLGAVFHDFYTSQQIGMNHTSHTSCMGGALGDNVVVGDSVLPNIWLIPSNDEISNVNIKMTKYFIHFLAKLDHSETNDHEHSGKIGLHTVVCAKHLHTLRSLLKMINLLTFVFSFKFTLKASIIGKFLKERSKLLDDLVTKRKTSFRKMCCKHHFKLWLNLVFTKRCCAILTYNDIYVAWFHAEKFCEIAKRLELCSVKIGHPRKVLLQFNLAWKVQASGTGLVDRLKHSQD